MAAPRGNHNARGVKGNKGGGRLKRADEQYLLDLWNGKIGLPKVIEKKEKYYNIASKKLEGKLCVYFKSGKDAFAFKVLSGEDSAVRTLLAKLYADKSEAKVIGDPDNPIAIQVYLPALKNGNSN